MTNSNGNGHHQNAFRTLREVLRLIDGAGRASATIENVACTQDEHGQALEALKVQQQTIFRLLTRQADLIEALHQRQELLEAASRHQQILSERFFDERVIDPLVHAALPAFNLIADYLGRSRVSDSAPCGDHELRVLEGVQALFLEYLSIYEVVPIINTPGSAFDPRIMRVIEREPTPDAASDMMVVASVRPGFRRRQRVLQPENVIIFQFTPPAKENEHAGFN